MNLVFFVMKSNLGKYFSVTTEWQHLTKSLQVC